MHRSRVSRSVAALMATLVMLQLVVAGSGMACTMSPAGMTRGMGGRAIGATMVRHQMTAAGPLAMNGGMAHMPRQRPSHRQGSAPTCRAMRWCITAFVATPIRPDAANVRPSPRVIALVVLAPASRAFPPELPPPRA